MISALLALGVLAGLTSGEVPAQAATPAEGEGGRPARVLRAGEREVVALLLTVPAGELVHTHRSELYRLISEVLRAQTSFRLHELDLGPELDKCRGNIACLVLRARPDFDPEYPGDARRDPAAPRWLLVLSASRPSPAEDRVKAILVDTELALELHHPALEEHEALILERAVLAAPEPLVLRDPAQVAPSLERLLGALLPSSRGSELAWVDVESTIDGVEVELDGTPLGAAGVGRTRIEELRPGPRRLLFRHVGYESAEYALELDAGAGARLELILIPRETASVASTRAVFFWTGLGVTAAGAALVTASVVRAATASHSRVCFGEPGAYCPSGPMFVRTSAPGDDPLGAPAGTGLLLGPLGLSVLVAGAGLTTGSYLEGELAPWIAAGAGIATGLLTYGLAAALDDGSGPAR